MSDLIQTVEKQAIDSELITLFDLEYADGQFAYFSPEGKDESLADIQFRDTGGTARTYITIPAEADGFSVNSDGAYSRPEITIANALSTFKTSIGNLDYEDLIGRRITKRTTLKKYLVGESGDATPPVEFPKTTYVIDRIKDKTLVSITFELAAPFDLAGLMLPKRVIIGGACPWKYTGADQSRALTDIEGGCNWAQDSKFYVNGSSTAYYPYLNKNDEYILPLNSNDAPTGTGHINGNATLVTGNSQTFQPNAFYHQTGISATLIGTDGSTSSTVVAQYWQCIAPTATTTAPSASSSLWRKIRTYTNYSQGTQYKGYRNKEHNEYVKHTVNGVSTVWQVTRQSVVTSASVAPGETEFFTRGDICGKKVTSCALRFQAKPNSPAGFSRLKSTNALPFGGYPGAAARR